MSWEDDIWRSRKAAIKTREQDTKRVIYTAIDTHTHNLNMRNTGRHTPFCQFSPRKGGITISEEKDKVFFFCVKLFKIQIVSFKVFKLKNHVNRGANRSIDHSPYHWCIIQICKSYKRKNNQGCLDILVYSSKTVTLNDHDDKSRQG